MRTAHHELQLDAIDSGRTADKKSNEQTTNWLMIIVDDQKVKPVKISTCGDRR